MSLQTIVKMLTKDQLLSVDVLLSRKVKGYDDSIRECSLTLPADIAQYEIGQIREKRQQTVEALALVDARLRALIG